MQYSVPMRAPLFGFVPVLRRTFSRKLYAPDHNFNYRRHVIAKHYMTFRGVARNLIWVGINVN